MRSAALPVSLLIAITTSFMVGCDKGTTTEKLASVAPTSGEPAGAQFARDMKAQGLTSADLPQVKQLLLNEDKFARVKGLTAMFFAKPEAVRESVEIATKALEDKDPLVRQYALSAVHRLDPSEGKKLAVRFKDDPNEFLSEKANKILASP